MSNKIKVGDVGTVNGKTGFWKIIEADTFTIGIESIGDARDRVRIEKSDFSLTDIKFTVVDMTDSNKIQDYMNSNKVLVDYVSSLKSEIEELEKRLAMLETSAIKEREYTFDEIQFCRGNYRVIDSNGDTHIIHINEFSEPSLISNGSVYAIAINTRRHYKYIKIPEDVTITLKAL